MAKEWAKAFYKSKEWRTMRRFILHRDLFTCEECGGSVAPLEVTIASTPAYWGA